MLDIDWCAGTFLVAKVYMFHSQFRQLVGSNMGSECVAACLLQLAVVFIRQELIRKSHISGEDNMQHASLTYVKAMEALAVKRRINEWRTFYGFLTTPQFSFHLL